MVLREGLVLALCLCFAVVFCETPTNPDGTSTGTGTDDHLTDVPTDHGNGSQTTESGQNTNDNATTELDHSGNTTTGNSSKDSATSGTDPSTIVDPDDSTNKTENGTSSASETSTATPVSSTTDSNANATTPNSTAGSDTPTNSTTEEDTSNSTIANTTITPDTSTNTTESSETTIAPDTSANTTANSTSSTTQPPAVPSTPEVKISETNLLLVNTSKTEEIETLFVELCGNSSSTLTNVWLEVRNAQISAEDANGMLAKLNLESLSLGDNGRLVLTKSNGLDLTQKMSGVKAVVISLYTEEPSGNLTTLTQNPLDSLVYSKDGNIDHAVGEVFLQDNGAPTQDFNVIDYSNFGGSISKLSMSRCPDQLSTLSTFVLTTATSGEVNNCTLPETHRLEMKLTQQMNPSQDCPGEVDSDHFMNTLIDKFVVEVNTRKRCGLSPFMLQDMHLTKTCTADKVTEVNVKFTLRSVLQDQLTMGLDGYKEYVKTNPDISMNSGVYHISNCTEVCVKPVVAPSDDSDNKIKVTVAVVISCICIFLVVLAVVILYLRKKKKGILQFRMTRLDEDDDDLIGDMDDFVGNQGPTFRNFR